MSLRPHLIVLPRWEAVITRLLLAWFLWQALPTGSPPWTEQPHPAGLGHFFDFTWLSHKETFNALHLLARIGIILYAVGIIAPVGLFAFLVLDVPLHTLATSQGIFGHGAQLNALIALGLISGFLWAAFKKGGKPRTLLLTSKEGDQDSIQAARLMLAATYVVAGLSKLYHGGFGWPFRGEAFVLQVLKAQDEMRFTWIVPPLQESAIQMGEFLGRHPTAGSIMLSFGLLLELGAFAACLGRLPALLIGVGMLSFHLSNEWLMGLPFRGNQYAVIMLFIHPLYWLSKLIAPIRKTLPAEVTLTSTFKNWLLHPASVSVLLGFFMLWRGEWYPFSKFPMYSILPPMANAYYATDMQDKVLPLMKLGTNAPTLKKGISTELRIYKQTGQIKRYSDLTQEQQRDAVEKVVKRMQDIPNHPIHQHNGFRIYTRDYVAKDGEVTITNSLLAEFPPPQS